MFNSLRYRILVWFIIAVVFMGLVLFPANYLYNRSKNRIESKVSNLSQLHIQFLNDKNTVADFLNYEISNPDFFITGESSYLEIHYEIQKSIQSDLLQAFNKDKSPSSLSSSFESLSTAYNSYFTLIDSLVHKIYHRGYRDFGLEGKMVSHIYKLENQGNISSNSLNELRLAEREYLNRNDTSYAKKVNKLCHNLMTSVLMNNSYSVEEKKNIILLVRAYQDSFNELVDLDQTLGLKSNSGYKKDLSYAGKQIESLILVAKNEAGEYQKAQLFKLNLSFAILTLLFLSLSIYFISLLSRYLVSHLEQLANYISILHKSNFKHSIKLDLHNSSKEIRDIYMEFRNMLAELKIRENQRNKALTRVEESEQRYREMADLLPQSIYETDQLGNLIYANHAWFNTFGYDESELQNGINLIEILNTDYSDSLFTKSKIQNTDFIAIRKDGTRFPATVFSESIFRNKKIIGHRGIIIDSTLRNKYINSLKKETLRAITSDQHKSSFLANMSHEIRTPMNSIIGFANLLSSEHIPSEQKLEFVKLIQSSGQMLLGLIDDIIDIAKIEAGEIKIKKGECQPIKLVKELAIFFEEFKSQIQKQHIALILDLPKDEILFKTDEFRLRQVLTNLISNAIKYTEQGSITIRVSKPNQRSLEFSVEDTGIGMSTEELSTVFERFKRTKTSERKNISGTGLGLAISKNLVTLLGGQMWVTSQPSLGSRFSFELPYIYVPVSIPVEDKVSKPENYNWTGKKVLIAEDDENSYYLIEQILNRTGIELIRARNGAEAVEAVKFENNIELILMDIQMPKLNGLEATKIIKKTHPNIPVISQTAFAMEGDRESSKLAGCDDYITKPLHPENLLAKMGQFLKPVINQQVLQSASNLNFQKLREEDSKEL